MVFWNSCVYLPDVFETHAFKQLVFANLLHLAKAGGRRLLWPHLFLPCLARVNISALFVAQYCSGKKKKEKGGHLFCLTFGSMEERKKAMKGHRITKTV